MIGECSISNRDVGYRGLPVCANLMEPHPGIGVFCCIAGTVKMLLREQRQAVRSGKEPGSGFSREEQQV